MKTATLKLVTLESPMPLDWEPLDERLTLGKSYIVVIHEPFHLCWSCWSTTQCSVVDDEGNEIRVLGGHFEQPL